MALQLLWAQCNFICENSWYVSCTTIGSDSVDCAPSRAVIIRNVTEQLSDNVAVTVAFNDVDGTFLRDHMHTECTAHRLPFQYLNHDSVIKIGRKLHAAYIQPLVPILRSKNAGRLMEPNGIKSSSYKLSRAPAHITGCYMCQCRKKPIKRKGKTH